MEYNQLPLHHFAKEIRKYLKKGKTKGLIFGNFGACNLGDEAILAGELTELKNIPTTSVKVVSRYPQKVKQLHGVDSIHFFSLASTLKNILISDYIIFGGGGLICKNDMGVRGILFQLYTITMFLLLPLLLRKKVFVIGLGIYENTPTITKKITLFLFSFVHILGVRDHASYLFLKKHHLPVKEYKDSSFLLPLPEESSKPLWSKTNKVVVGLAINKPHKAATAENLIHELTTFMVKYKDSTHFIFYSLDCHPLYSNDRRFAKKIIKIIEESGTFSYDILSMNEHPRNIFSSFYHLDFMIASRLHASIFSYRTETPFYGIAYDSKCESFLASINHQYTFPQSVTSDDISLYFDSAKKVKEESIPQTMQKESEAQL